MSQVIEQITEFLATPNKQYGDWPNISNDEIYKFYDVVTALADAKWGRDCDNDSPINIKIMDKQKHHQMQPFIIDKIETYRSKKLKQELMKQIVNELNRANANVEHALTVAEQLRRSLEELIIED